jgi:sulfoxide reductase catalytic subunit YedY
MLVRSKRGWEIPERDATAEHAFNDRRRLVKAIAAGPILAAASPLLGLGGAARAADAPADPSASLYPVQRNLRYRLDRDLTEEKHATQFNNFYEFGSQKGIWEAAQKLPIRPWTVKIEGMVEKPMTVAIDDLLKQMPLEERLYRHRCVEAWSMAVPWSGFPMKAFVEFAKPLASAKYVMMATLADKKTMPGLRQFWYPWPYMEGLTIAEATNELAFLVTGMYGKPVPRQNGAPLRLAVPWKYGFKSTKSIVTFTFTDKRGKTFWEVAGPDEYGFWANVNPQVAHPRWSQATEEVLGTGKRVPTQLYNGYAEFVAELYKGLENEKLFM